MKRPHRSDSAAQTAFRSRRERRQRDHPFWKSNVGNPEFGGALRNSLRTTGPLAEGAPAHLSLSLTSDQRGCELTADELETAQARLVPYRVVAT